MIGKWLGGLTAYVSQTESEVCHFCSHFMGKNQSYNSTYPHGKMENWRSLWIANENWWELNISVTCTVLQVNVHFSPSIKNFIFNCLNYGLADKHTHPTRTYAYIYCVCILHIHRSVTTYVYHTCVYCICIPHTCITHIYVSCICCYITYVIHICVK